MIGTTKQILNWLFDQPNDKNWDIREHRDKRSLSQNAYFHVLVGKIAKVLKVSNTAVKNKLIADYGFYDADVGHVIVKDTLDYLEFEQLHLKPSTKTQTMANGELYRVFFVMRGTHTYNTAEMTRVLDAAVAEAKALDIETLPPEELQRMKEMSERREQTYKDKAYSDPEKR